MLIALVGNQNCGKSTLFNGLTKGRRKTGNFPGVSTDAGYGEILGHRIVDLPGLYSINSAMDEELITASFLENNKVDIVLNIVDATNLNRNLYLTMQLLEKGYKTILALNMIDELEENGAALDVEKLRKYLGIPVFAVSASKNIGIDTLKAALVKKNSFDFRMERVYKGQIFEHINRDKGLLAIYENASKCQDSEKEKRIFELEKRLNSDRQALLVDMRYEAIERLVEEAITDKGVDKAMLKTQKIDRILTHRYFAIPIFIVIMGVIFYLTFSLFGKLASQLVGIACDYLIELSKELLISLGVSDAVISLICQGVLSGIASVISFVPMIILLFFFLSIIEDSGYMARIAFVMDGLMRKIGLNGKAVVPLLIGFGCSVPAYMATRTLKGKREKRFASMLIPFISCSAKIPVYSYLSVLFFGKYAALVILALYFFNIILGILIALMFKKTVFKPSTDNFLLELPPYRFPSVRTVGVYLCEKANGFLKKAFSVILLASVAVWFFTSFGVDFKMVDNSSESLMAHFASIIAPVFAPLGFGNWQSLSAVIAGLVAKEAMLSSFTVLSGSIGTEALLRTLFTPESAFSFLIFTSLYCPCVAAFAALKKESESLSFSILAMTFQTVFAYLVSAIVYRLI